MSEEVNHPSLGTSVEASAEVEEMADAEATLQEICWKLLQLKNALRSLQSYPMGNVPRAQQCESDCDAILAECQLLKRQLEERQK